MARRVPDRGRRLQHRAGGRARLVVSLCGARSIDVAMYLVDCPHGQDAARGVGRGLIIDRPPAKGSMAAAAIPPRSGR